MEHLSPPVRSHFRHDFDLEYHGELTDETSKMPDINRGYKIETVMYSLTQCGIWVDPFGGVRSCMLVRNGYKSQSKVVFDYTGVPVDQKHNHLL